MKKFSDFALIVIAVMAGYALAKQAATVLNNVGFNIAVSGQ